MIMEKFLVIMEKSGENGGNSRNFGNLKIMITKPRQHLSAAALAIKTAITVKLLMKVTFSRSDNNDSDSAILLTASESLEFKSEDSDPLLSAFESYGDFAASAIQLLPTCWVIFLRQGISRRGAHC